jgi:two-component system, sensor histidine kinase RegB
MLEFPLLSLAPTAEALRRLIGLRYVIVALLAVAIVFAKVVLGTAIQWTMVAAGLGLLLLVNMAIHRRVARQRSVSERELFTTFIIEVFALTGVLWTMGGSASPLVSLYLLPLTVAANLLRRRHTWIVALVTALCYSALIAFDVPVDEHDHAAVSTQFSQHVLGMWAIFVVSAALVAHYVSSLAQSLRERDRQLAQAREEGLRNERIVALGMQSAGAAHELSTPLASISVLAEDMARRHTHDPELADDVALLQGEVARCKQILNALAARAGSTSDEGEGMQSPEAFIRATLERWQLVRPVTPAVLRWVGTSPSPCLPVDRTLEQALHNLLDNAADASPAGFDVAGTTDAGKVVIDILDQGPGLSAEVQARVGEPFFTTKGPDGGMGVGIFLANATIERFGGSVHWFNRPGGGCCTRITLPCLVDTAPGASR